MEGSQEGFVVSEEKEKSTLQVVAEVDDGGVDGQQLSVKHGVMALHGRELGGVEGKGHPVGA